MALAEQIGGHESDILSATNIPRWLNFTSFRIKFSLQMRFTYLFVIR